MFTYARSMFSIAAKEISVTDFQGTSFDMDFGVLTSTPRTSASISLPESLFNGIANATQIGTFRMIHATFENGSIFPSPEIPAMLGSAVIAASVVGYPVNNLQDPVVINLSKNEASF